MSSRIIRNSVRSADPVQVAFTDGTSGGGQPACVVEKGWCRDLLDQARIQAQEVLDGAAAEAEALRLQAFAAGLEEGRVEGVTQVLQEAAPHLARLAELAAVARVDRETLLDRLEAALPELALAVARKVVAAELTLNPDVIVTVVRDGLAVLRGQTVVRVRVAPADLEALCRSWSELWPPELGPQPAVMADSRMEPGGCVIDTMHGALDGRLATRFVEVGRMFGLALEEDPPESIHV